MQEISLITSLVGFSSQTWVFFSPSKFYTSGQIWLSKVGEKEQSHYRITYLWILRSTKRNPPGSFGDKHFIIEMFKNQPRSLKKGSLFVSSRLVTLFLPNTRAKRFAKECLLRNPGNHSLRGVTEAGKDSDSQPGVFPKDGRFQLLESEITVSKTAERKREVARQG